MLVALKLWNYAGEMLGRKEGVRAEGFLGSSLRRKILPEGAARKLADRGPFLREGLASPTPLPEGEG